MTELIGKIILNLYHMIESFGCGSNIEKTDGVMPGELTMVGGEGMLCSQWGESGLT